MESIIGVRIYVYIMEKISAAEAPNSMDGKRANESVNVSYSWRLALLRLECAEKT